MQKSNAESCREYRERRKAKGLPLTRGEPRSREQEEVYQKQYQNRPEAKQRTRIRQAERRKDQSEIPKITARNMINQKILKGEVSRQPCQKCGNAKSEAHHEDYSRPLDVQWLCKTCHEEKHTAALYCDGAGPHSRLKESRVLPTGGEGNGILCRLCFIREIQFRKERNRELGKAEQFDLPEWGSLKPYGEPEPEAIHGMNSHKVNGD